MNLFKLCLSVCRSVKLWDLEKFSLVGSMEGNTSPVQSVARPRRCSQAAAVSSLSPVCVVLCCCVVLSRCICFSPDGGCLFSGSTDSLRVFGWEPDRCFDVVLVGWGKVSDLALCNQQLVSVELPLEVRSATAV